MKFLRAVGDWFGGLSSAKRHLMGTLLTLAMVAGGVPVQIASIAGQLMGATGLAVTPAPEVVPPVQLQIGVMPDILQGLVPSAPETSTRDTQGPPEVVR